MPLFPVKITAQSVSPVIRKMHTHTRLLIAPDLQTAQKMIKQANGTDDTWHYSLEPQSYLSKAVAENA